MQKVTRAVLSILPFVIVAGLLYAAYFIKPTVRASHVEPSAIERGDYVYGIASPASGVVLGVGSGGKTWRFEGAGRSIHLTQSPTGSMLQDVASWDLNDAVAVGDTGTVLVTKDGGRSWTSVKVALSSVANKLVRVRTFGDGSAWTVGEMGGALRTTDRGVTWQRMTPDEDKAWNDVYVDGGKVLLVGEFGRISQSDDGGRTWTNIASPVKASLMAVSFRDALDGVAVGVNGATAATRDGGQTWNAVSPITRNDLFDVTWDGEHWLAVGERGVLLIGDATGGQWRVSSVASGSREWHTKIIRDGQQYLASGGSLDIIDAR